MYVWKKSYSITSLTGWYKPMLYVYTSWWLLDTCIVFLDVHLYKFFTCLDINKICLKHSVICCCNSGGMHYWISCVDELFNHYFLKLKSVFLYSSGKYMSVLSLELMYDCNFTSLKHIKHHQSSYKLVFVWKPVRMH